MDLITILIIVVAVALVINNFIKWSIKNYDHFEKIGVDYIRPKFLLGTNYGIIFRTKSIFDATLSKYREFPNARIVGMFDFRTPSFLARDLEIIRQIAIKDFEYFTDHRSVMEPDTDPMFSSNLINLKGQKWKEMRASLSPAFTSSKMKQMFESMIHVGEQLANYVKNEASQGKEFEVKDIFSRLTNDVIASSAFGVKVDSLKDNQNEFFTAGKKIMDFNNFKAALRIMGFMMFPKLMSRFGLSMLDPDPVNYFAAIMRETMHTRETNNIVRHDIINLLLQLKKAGSIQHNSVDDQHTDQHDGYATVQESNIGKVNVKREWSEAELLGQCLIFFLAGFDTASTAMSFTAYELALNPEVQQKLIAEVDRVAEELGDKPIDYETLQRMKYLDMTISESLRKWPPAPMTDRVCVKDYTMKNDKGQDITISKGTWVWIPIVGLHHDAKYFKDPERFIPERFTDAHSINPMTYCPFGIGPRSCIGSRFALLEVKVAFYSILKDFTFEVSEKTDIPIRIRKGFGMVAENGVWLRLKPRSK